MEEKTKKLYRSQRDKILFGVCGGLGDYFEIDTTIVRIACILLTLVSGVGIIAYIVFLLIVPKEISEEEVSRSENLKEFATATSNHAKRIIAEAKETQWGEQRKMFGGILILIGFFLLVQKLFHLFDWWWMGKIFWPVLIMFFGLLLLIRSKK